MRFWQKSELPRTDKLAARDISGIVVLGDVRGNVIQNPAAVAGDLAIPWSEPRKGQSVLAWLSWKSRISAFTGRGFAEFPTEAIPFSVFCALTDAEGTGRIELRVSDVETSDTVYRLTGPIEFRDRLTPVHANFRLRDVRFPIPGVYAIDLLVDGDLITQRRLRVYQTES